MLPVGQLGPSSTYARAVTPQKAAVRTSSRTDATREGRLRRWVWEMRVEWRAFIIISRKQHLCANALNQAARPRPVRGLAILRELRQLETNIFYEKDVISCGRLVPVPFWCCSENYYGTTKIFCESGSLTLLPGLYPLTSMRPPLGSNGL